MKLRSLSLLAAVLLVAACAHKAPESTGTQTTTEAPPPPPPSGPAPGSLADFQQNVGDRVFFDFDKSDIKSEGQQTLQKQADWLKKYPKYTVTIAGHCDDRGTREYNLALGERRANAAKQALIALGVPAARVSTISYGKENPDPVGDNDAAWAQNRRAVTVLNGG
jgi:peptidoglycan-associated lipoprotein